MIKFKKFIPIFLLVLITSLIYNTNVFAAVNTGSSYFHGYSASNLSTFDYCGSGSGVKYHRVLCGGAENASVTDDGVNFSKSKFLSYINGLLASGDTNQKIGASFIVHTMIGAASPHGTVAPTSDEIAEWTNRVNNGAVTVAGESYYYTINSGYVRSSGGTYDDKFYIESGTADSWVFRDGDGRIVYALKKRCANPVGELDGLPVKVDQWSLHATSTNNTSGAAKPGDTIVWNHSLINDGAGPTTASVHSNLGITGFSNGWGTTGEYGGGDSPAGSGLGTIRTITDYATYGVVQADVGHTLCEKVQFDPSNSTGGRDGRGNDSCVYIAPNWNITATSTINRTTAAPGDRIIWTHNLNNGGPTYTTDRVYSRLEITGIPEWPSGTDIAGAYTEGGQGIGVIRNITDYATYDVQQRDVGKTLCEQVQFQRIDNGAYGSGNNICIYIPYNWAITPTSTINDTSKNKPGDTITWTHKVTNDGKTATNRDVSYYYKDASGAVDNHQLDSGTAIKGSASFESSYTVTQADVGKDICRATGANPKSSSDTGVTTSDSACINIPYSFSLTPETKISVDKQTPGSTITFQHKITNNGKTKTNAPVTYTTHISRVNLPASSSPSLGNVTAGTNLQEKLDYDPIPASNTGNNNGSAKILIDWFNYSYQIKQDDVNNWVCGYLSAKPASQNNPPEYVSSFICKFIPYDYTLTPSVTVNPSEYIESGATYTVSPSVNNSGPTKSESIEWQLTRTIVLPGKTIDNKNGGISDTEPCTYYDNANAVCSRVETGTTVFNNDSTWLSGTKLDKYISEAGDYAVGTHICFALSVKPYKNGENKWSHSVAVCIIVSKKPKVQVWGGDLISGGGVTSSTSIKGISMFGSWVEYGIFAAGLIKGTASGSAFAGNGLTPISTPVSPCGYSMLSFVNAGTSACSSSSIIGNYTSSWPVTDIAASFPGDGEPISGTFVPSSTGEGVHIYSAGDLKLDTSELFKKTVIIKASGTVTIIGNQTYSNGPYTNVSDLPQLVIIAKDIVINGDVKNVDAWLVAKPAVDKTGGSIKTCNEIGNTVGKCNNKLTVNGPVIAKTLYLYRTAGSGIENATAIGDPAEVFNLRADAYLWATARANVNSKIQTVYTTELPPRF